MGNESSVPGEGAGSDLEDLEQLEQQQQQGNSSNASKSTSDTAQDGKRRAGARMIGAVFGKSNRHLQATTSSSTSTNNQQQPPQHSTSPQDVTATGNNPMLDHSESSHSSFYEASMTSSPPPSADAAGVISHDVFAQQQQQQQATALPKQASSDSLDVTERTEHPAVGVMFEKTPTKKSLFPGRATARGAALISSMRNLTVSAFSKSIQNKKDESDWEKQWDEDEEEDSSEDEDEDAADDSSSFDTGTTTSSTALHEQIRPPMDVGHAEMPIPPQSSSSFQSAATTEPSMLIPSQVAQQQEPHDLATEWDMAGIQPPTAVVDSSTLPSSSSQPQSQPQSQSTVLLPSTTTLPQTTPDSMVEKPNVQMFLPMLRVLGKGSFGKVVLVQKRAGKERGGLFAMKILRKTHLVKRRQIERTRTERKVLSVVNHPFIMKLHYAFQTPDKLYLVLDYCPGGELFFHLSRFRRFPERVARFYAAELLLAIGHLHKRGIIYRDLKPENVLLDAEGHVKLGDFGLAKAGIKHPCEGASSMCGTPEYMAPEVLAQAGHGFCVDYWGLGMLLYEMMTGLPPWYTTDRAKLFRRLKSSPLDIPSYFSIQAANCASALLERNPRRRLGVTGIRTSMEHEFFRNISWKSLYARRVEAPIRPCEGWKPPENSTTDNPSEEDDRIVASTDAPGGQAMSLADIEGIHPHDLDDATKNFDNTFTRMPVESEEMGNGDHSEDAEMSEHLNEETFLGFSFDHKERDITTPQSSPGRARAHAVPLYNTQDGRTDPPPPPSHSITPEPRSLD